MKRIDYTPDNWVVLEIKGKIPHYRVLGGWSGGYLNESSWRLNSGVTYVEKDGKYLLFGGSSGSVYKCHKERYGLKMNNAHVWYSLKEKYSNKISLLKKDTDWSSLRYLKGTH